MSRIASIAVAVAFTIGLAGTAQAASLVYCAEGSPTGFDPARHTDPATQDASAEALYNRLVEFAPGTTNIVPGLAERWTVSSDAREYTFHLRPDVHFTPTAAFTPSRAVNADDVIFSFARQWKEGDPWRDAIGADGWPWFTGMAMPFVLRDIRKVDDLTVTFVLERPHAPFLSDLAMGFSSILSKEYADGLAATGDWEKLDTAPVGTGPFRLAEHVPGALVRYEANPEHWRGKPPLDSLVFDVTPDPGVRFEKLKSGECQAIPSPNVSDLAAIRSADDLTLLESPGLALAYLAFNTTKPPFDAPEARRAVSAAIDRHEIIDNVFGGVGAASVAMLSPLMSGGGDSAPPALDPEAARQVVTTAGISGAGLPLWWLAAIRPYSPDPGRMAEMIASDLDTAGLDATLVSPSAATFLADSLKPDRDGAVLLGWVSDNADPDNLLAPLLGCDAVGISNRANWCNPRFDALLAEARAETDATARAQLYAEADRIIAAEAPIVPVLYAGHTLAVRAGITGLVADPFGRHNFATASVGE